MSFADVVRKSWRDNRLFSALVELTYRCNWDCYFCYNDLSLEGRPLTVEQYRRFFDDLAELGAFNLILSGGEPLAHPAFFELGAYARDLGFVVRVKSNGHALRGETARRLREEVDPFMVEVSLHGATAATHDRQTRVPGSFDRLVSNVGELMDLGVRVKMNTTLTAWNEHELEEMIDLARRLGVQHQIDPEVTARDDGDAEPLSIRPSRQAIGRLFRIQSEARRGREAEEPEGAAAGPGPRVERQGDAMVPSVESGKHCGAGSATLAVDPFGSVYPCVQWRQAIGNLHERSLTEMWAGSEGLARVREANAEVKRMIDGLGPEAPRMGFCPGAAVAATGRPTGLYGAAATKLALQRETAESDAGGVLPIVR